MEGSEDTNHQVILVFLDSFHPHDFQKCAARNQPMSCLAQFRLATMALATRFPKEKRIHHKSQNRTIRLVFVKHFVYSESTTANKCQHSI